MQVRKIVIVLIGILLSANIYADNSQRIVVGGGSLTEIVYALGAQDLLVGRDSSSTYPSQAQSLPDVGYYRTLNTEGLLSVQPSDLILLEGAGPTAVIDQLSNLGVKVTLVKNPKSIEGLLFTIETIAELVDKESQGKALIERVVNQLDVIKNQIKIDNKRAVFLMSAGERGMMAAGSNTTPQLIFDLLDIENPYSELDGFKPISAESLAAVPPDVIFIASHTTRGVDETALCASNYLKLWVSLKGCQLHKIDSLKFLGLTPRLPEAIEQTANIIAQ